MASYKGVTIRPGEDVDAQVRAINDSTALTSTSLMGQPNIKLPPPPMATETTNALGALEALTKGIQGQTKPAKEQKDSSLSALIKSEFGTKTQSQLTQQAYKDTGADDAQAEVASLQNQLEQEQYGLTKEIERIKKNEAGLFGGALEDRVSEAEAKSLSKQADIAIILGAKTRQFDVARQIADRAVQAQLESDRKRNDLLKFVYEEHKDTFDKEEQRAFTFAQNERERLLAQKEARLRETNELSINALQNGAPASLVSKMRQAASPEHAIAIGGQYVGLLDRQYKIAQINKIGMDNLIAEAEANDRKRGILNDKDIKAIDTSPQGKSLNVAANLKLKLSTYQDLVEKYGFETFGANKATLESAYTELQLAYKEAANLGVLNGPDLGLVEKAIRSATPGLFGNIGNVLRLGQGTRNLTANLEQAQSTLNNAASLHLEQLYARDPAYRDSLYIKSLTLPFGDELLLSDELADMDAVAGPSN